MAASGPSAAQNLAQKNVETDQPEPNPDAEESHGIAVSSTILICRRYTRAGHLGNRLFPPSAFLIISCSRRDKRGALPYQPESHSHRRRHHGRYIRLARSRDSRLPLPRPSPEQYSARSRAFHRREEICRLTTPLARGAKRTGRYLKFTAEPACYTATACPRACSYRDKVVHPCAATRLPTARRSKGARRSSGTKNPHP